MNLTRQQLCAELSISESTIRRLELIGLPYTPIGIRGKRYDLAEVKTWLKQCQYIKTNSGEHTSRSWSAANAFTDLCRKAHLRVMPSQ